MHEKKLLLQFLVVLYAISLLECRYHAFPTAHESSISNLYSENDGEECEEKSGNKTCGNSLGKGNPKSKASNIAQKAAAEAKAASDAQMAAAEAAATQVKQELAEKAAQSARAAEAALAGKQQILEQLQQELVDADVVVSEVSSSLQGTQTNANAAMQAAADALNSLNILKRLVTANTQNYNNIENVASSAQQELTEKTQLLEAAKKRVECLHRQITDARQDFEKTKMAAYKAACAALDAKQKASRTRRMTGVHKLHCKEPIKHLSGSKF